MTNRVQSHMKTADLPGLTGCPTQIDEYVEWFNQRFTFAKARVLRDARGIKFLDIEYGK